jgi:uncharacterized membrane protein
MARPYPLLCCAFLAVLLTTHAACQPADDVIWLEAESSPQAADPQIRIDRDTSDYGSMAESAASGKVFVRFSPGVTLPLPPFTVRQAGERVAWVRAFNLAGRRVTVAIDGKPVGTSGGSSTSIALVWHRLGTVHLEAGQHQLELRPAADNTNAAYVDAVALLSDPKIVPFGSSSKDLVGGEPVPSIHETFSAGSVQDLEKNWLLRPPPGADALVEMAPREDDGALRVHNGAGQGWSLTSRVPIALKPGDQVTIRVRVRKGTLCEWMSVGLAGLGSFSPQLYRNFQVAEETWLVPPGVYGPFLLQINGGAGGDTYLSSVEVFRPDPALSPFVTGRFIAPLDNNREGRLFEIERYVVNTDALTTDTDEDGDGKWSVCRLSREDNTPRFSRGTVLKSDTVAADRERPEDGCAPLHVRVGPLVPGRYQVALNASGRALGLSLDGKVWTRLPGSVPAQLGVLKLEQPYFDFWLDDRYAEPGNPGPTYADYIHFMPIEDPAYTLAPTPRPDAITRGSVERRQVSLTIANNTGAVRTREPVRSGVPIPQGELADAEHVRLLDAAGRVVPCYAQVTGHWMDGSVKWLLLDFAADVAARESARFTLEYGNSVQATPVPAGLTLRRDGTKVSVDTGAARYDFEGGGFTAYLPGSTQPALQLADGLVQGSDGRSWRQSLDRTATVEVEEQTPLRVVLRLRGRFCDDKGSGPIAFDHRVHLFAGRAEAQIEYGFFATADESTVPLKQVSVRLAGPWADQAVRFGLAEGVSPASSVAARPRLLQTGEETHGAGHFPYSLTDSQGRSLATGEAAPGWLGIDGPSPVMVALPDFHQQYPKALACEPGAVLVDLWPSAPGVEPFLAHAGAGKSHVLGLSLQDSASPERWLSPLFAAADPAWYCSSGAFENLVPRRAGKYEAYETIVDTGFDRFLAERAGYGMENWGDAWQPGYVPDAKTWSNHEWDLVNSWVIAFVRTGDRRYLDFSEAASRHYADVDCIHYSRSATDVGGAWMHAHTSLVGHQLEAPNFAHAGWAEGMLNLYHLTGDRRGFEASRGIADWIVRRAPQVDRLPAGGPPYNLMIQRPAGWPLTTLVLLYRETWKPEYLQTARRIADYARRSQDPERGAWDAQVGHEVPYRGGCVFAFTLLRGLQLLGEVPGEAQAREDYVKAGRWLLCELWRPDHRYLYEQCPLHEPGTLVPFTLSEMAGYCTALSGDPMYAAIGHDALLQHSAQGAKSGMVGSVMRAQWAHGVVQQVPRMLYDWEQTGLETDSRLALGGQTAKLPRTGQRTISVMLHNGSPEAFSDLQAECMVRGDWKAEIVSCPRVVEAGQQAEIQVKCEVPPPLQQYELQNDLAYLHLLVRGKHAGQPTAVWGWMRLEIAPPLEITTPVSVALKRGTEAEYELTITDGVEDSPHLEVTVTSEVAGVSAEVSAPSLLGHGQATVRLHVQADAKATPAAGELKLLVRSGSRVARAAIPVSIGRVRVLIVESGPGEEWRYPFNALRPYPGIAPDFMAAGDLKSAFPTSATEIARRWDVITLGDTGTGAEAFTAQQLQALADFVRAGGGLMTIGGAKCYTAGGYDRTPLAEILPVRLEDGSYAMGSIDVEVLDKTVVFFEHYEPNFPEFGAHQKLTARPEARVLARFTDGTPFLTLGEAGRGRVLSLGAIWNCGSGTAFRQWPNYGTFIGRCVRWAGKDL